LETWNLGNTTVRNPERIVPALRVFADICVGRTFDEAMQLRFYRALHSTGVLEGDVDAKSAGISGRKWASALNQLGLAIAWKRKPPARLTAVGELLLRTDDPDEVFLRQLLKYQLPNPLERPGLVEGFAVHPLWVVVRVCLDLFERGMVGVTGDEIALYVNSTTRDEHLDSTLASIERFRRSYQGARGGVAKRELFAESLAARVLELHSTEFKLRARGLQRLFRKKGTLEARTLSSQIAELTAGGKGAKTRLAIACARMIRKMFDEGKFEESQAVLTAYLTQLWGRTFSDYADTTIRYSRITGLFTARGDKLAIKQDRLDLARAIAAERPELLTGEHYMEALYDMRMPRLPIEDPQFTEVEARHLEETAGGLLRELETIPGRRLPAPEVPAQGAARRKWFEYVGKLREAVFYYQQGRPASVEDILTYFTAILANTLMGGQAYRPAWFEWTVWRTFLVFDEIDGDISSTRNFAIDEDLNPVHHARAGMPDMAFPYPRRLLVCEVSLRTDERQWASEGEPVSRHVGTSVLASPDRHVTGVFVAPEIHPLSAEHFRQATYYEQEARRYFELEIVPLSVGQLEAVLNRFKKRPFGTQELLDHLDRLAALRKESRDGLDWLKQIGGEHGRWLAKRN